MLGRLFVAAQGKVAAADHQADRGLHLWLSGKGRPYLLAGCFQHLGHGGIDMPVPKLARAPEGEHAPGQELGNRFGLGLGLSGLVPFGIGMPFRLLSRMALVLSILAALLSDGSLMSDD